MKKLKTYFWYLVEYLKYGDFLSIIASARYLFNKSSHRRDRVIRTSIGTFFCRKNTNDFQFANFHYEWGVKKYLLDHKKDFNVFIDGGACVGDYCVLLSRYNIRCIAFEPVMNNFNVMMKNFRLNSLGDHVMAYPVGLGDVNGFSYFNFNPVNTGASHIVPDGSETDCKVEIRTFDSLVPSLKLNKDDFILLKLDLEGMEPAAIMGAKEFILQYPNITLVLEDKHTGEHPIKEALDSIAGFQYGIVDEFNIFATKISNFTSN